MARGIKHAYLAFRLTLLSVGFSDGEVGGIHDAFLTTIKVKGDREIVVSQWRKRNPR